MVLCIFQQINKLFVLPVVMLKLIVSMFMEFVQTTESDLPDGLKMFSQAISSSCVPRVMHRYPDLTCLSQLKIPFILPTELSAMLTTPVVKRIDAAFSDLQNVAQLVPDASTTCSKCFQVSWSEPHFFCSALIVTERELLPAHGMFIFQMVCKINIHAFSLKFSFLQW